MLHLAQATQNLDGTKVSNLPSVLCKLYCESYAVFELLLNMKGQLNIRNPIYFALLEYCNLLLSRLCINLESFPLLCHTYEK